MSCEIERDNNRKQIQVNIARENNKLVSRLSVEKGAQNALFYEEITVCRQELQDKIYYT